MEWQLFIVENSDNLRPIYSINLRYSLLYVISIFGPENITSSFTWNENELPLGTRIIEGPVGSKNPERFSGGEEGERQYRLIKRAEMLNKTNEKRKASR
jgi:hypothetical protein